MNDLDFWQKTSELIQSLSAMLFLVVNHEGSSPGKSGFKMLVSLDHQLGTIGGGVMEQNLISDAHATLSSNLNSPSIVIHKIHRRSADSDHQSGLICAGEQTMVRIQLSKMDVDLVNKICDQYLKASPALLVITSGSFDLSFAQAPGSIDTQNSTTDWTHYVPVGQVPTVHLFGAGHVGFAISQVLSPLNFHVVLHDNRPDLDQFENNPYADEKRTGSFEEMARTIPSGSHIYVIITTYSYLTDLEVLKEVVSKDVRYIGLMGSSAKINTIFNELKGLGTSQTQIDRIHAPIGLQIPNESAVEIAISIAAELISIKNSHTGE